MSGRTRNEEGYTISEVLISATITVLLITGVFGILQSVMSSYTIQSAQADSQSSAQLALLQMTREIRQAEKPLLAVYSYPGNYEELYIKADLNDDGVSEAVRYRYSTFSKQISKRVNTTGDFDFSLSPRQVIVSNVQNTYSQPVFTFYGTSLTTPLDPQNPSSDVINKTRLIKIRVVVDKDLNEAPKPIDLISEVKLRNFGY